MSSGWKRFIVGEPMPDKKDPKYAERYEREVAAGRQFAKKSGISRLACVLQSWGQSHKVLFIVLVFGFVLVCFGINVYRMVMMYHTGGTPKAVAVERLERSLQDHLHPQK